MAVSAGTVWECRQNGTTSGAGAFDSSLGGTDYSQQDAVQQAYTDLASVGGSTTVITSVARPFVATDVGNYIRITAGTGWTTGFFRIISVATGNATMDRAICTGGSTGGTGGFGGALRYPGDINGIIVAGNTLWIKDGLQVATAAQAPQFSASSGTSTNRVYVRGYVTTRGDATLTSRATITATATFGNGLLRVNSPYYVVRDFNLAFTGAGSGTQPFQSGTSSTLSVFYNITCLVAFVGDRGFECGGNYNVWRQCTITNFAGTPGATAGGFWSATGNYGVFQFCTARSCAGNGWYWGSGMDISLFEYCIGADCTKVGGNGGDGFKVASGTGNRWRNCVFARNAGNGLNFSVASGADSVNLVRCIFWGNAGYGIESTTDYSAATQLGLWQTLCNAFGGNTTGDRHNFPAGPDDEVLTAAPFSNTTDDFTLNYTAGGGKVIIDAPCSFLFPGTSTTVSLVPGVSVQTTAPTVTATTQSRMRSLWRLLTNEDDTTVVTDATVDELLWRGCQAFNRITKYYTKLSSSAVTLVAGTQEYSLPTDFNEMLYVYLGGKELKKADLARLQTDGDYWRSKTGEPEEFAIIGDKIIFLPIPDAKAVAADPAPVLRYVANPPDFATNGPTLLFDQDQPIPVYWAVVLWSAAHPDSALAVHRLTHHSELFKAEAAKAVEGYAARNLMH
jgi:hypothetical protein